MEKHFGIRVDDPLDTWVDKLKTRGIEVEGDKLSKTQLINIVGELVEPETETHPVFVVDMFKELSPLAKSKKAFTKRKVGNGHLTKKPSPSALLGPELRTF